MTKISRRDFFKLVGVGAAATGMSSCAGQSFLAEKEYEGKPLAEGEYASTVCQICPAGCGLRARRIDGRVVKVEGNPRHPLNQGKVCPRAQAAMQVLYDPDRVATPLRRIGERGQGQWEPISWQEAITQVAGRLRDLRHQEQARTFLFLHDAPSGNLRSLIDQFCAIYGSPNSIASGGLNAERIAHRLTQGWFDLAAHNWEETSYVLFFGGSFLEDWQPQTTMLRAYSYMRRGRPELRARIVQIGSRYSVSAAKADEWVPLLPGRQGVLALGMAHVIVKERLYDRNFVENHTEDFDSFAEMVLERYDPITVAGLTGVPVDTIARLAREFSGSQAAVAAAGRGLSESTNELFNHLAIHALNALAGSINAPGGVLYPRQPPFTPWPSDDIESLGPLMDGSLAMGAYPTLPERIMAGSPYSPKALFLHQVNPLFESAAANRWRGAFQSIPLVVSFSSYMDESTSHADLVLPNHTFLEGWVDATPPGGLGYPVFGLGRPVVAPLHDTRHIGDVLLEIARAIDPDMGTLLPWLDYEQMLRFRVQGLYEAGGSIQAESPAAFWDELVERGVWVGGPYSYNQWDNVLDTESGRFQFRLREMLEHSGDASALEMPEFAGEEAAYPLHLIPYQVIADAGCRAPNAPLLWEIYGLHLKEMWHSWVEINPETAHELGVEDHDLVWVESPQGRFRIKARIYEGVMPDAVNIPMGGGHTAGGRWARRVGGGNVAELVVPQTDPWAGTVAWCGTRVRVYKSATRSE